MLRQIVIILFKLWVNNKTQTYTHIVLFYNFVYTYFISSILFDWRVDWFAKKKHMKKHINIRKKKFVFMWNFSVVLLTATEIIVKYVLSKKLFNSATVLMEYFFVICDYYAITICRPLRHWDCHIYNLHLQTTQDIKLLDTKTTTSI